MGIEGQSHCVMAATSIVAGEAFSDAPECVCPTIRAALIQVNDSCPSDQVREKLLSHLPWLIIGTKSSDQSVLVERAKRFDAYAADAAAARDDARAAARAANAADAAARAANAAANAAYADAHAAHAAYADAHAANAAASAAYADAHAAYARAAWEATMRKFIEFIETDIIPVYTTMPIEPGMHLEKLVTHDA